MLSHLTASLARIMGIEARLQALLSPDEALDPCQDAAAASEGASSGSSRSGSAQPSRRSFEALVQQAAERQGLDPALLHAVIRAESDYNPNSVSHAGAMGLMQIMPPTARAYGVTDPFDPAQNLEAGARELRGYLDRFPNVELALAAYNAGPANVRKYGGIPPFPETQAYVPRVLEYWRQEQNRTGVP